MNKDMLSQDEIDVLLKGPDNNSDNDMGNTEISDIEKDALGEIGNISMGTAATTLSTLLDQKVTITTPKVGITTARKLAEGYPVPFVAIDVTYKAGLEGTNLLILKTDDVKVITDIMLGKTEIEKDRELTELDLSAVSEAMNQMMGSACTSLSEIFAKKIDIEPPNAYEITFSEGREKLEVLKSEEAIVKNSFRMIVGDIIDSEIMQLIPLKFAKGMVNKLLTGEEDYKSEETPSNPSRETEELDLNFQEPKKEIYDEERVIHQDLNNFPTEENKIKSDEPVVVKKPQFQAFDNKTNVSYNESINLVEDIPVEITAELGRATKHIGEILEYGPGTIIELDKLVGEPLNIYANGKFIAKGEVVVIDDNFGIRITDIPNPYKINS